MNLIRNDLIISGKNTRNRLQSAVRLRRKNRGSSILSSQAGFSLLELLIVIAVFAFAAGGIISLFSGIQGSQRRAEDLETARHAAELKIESLRNINYNNLTPNETLNFTNELPADLPDPKTGTAHITEPSPGLRRVDVTVSYNNGPNQREVKVSSVIGAIGITQ